MKYPILFGIITFIIGWLAQIIYIFLTDPIQTSPHWLLIAVLAIGSMGRTNMAQTLGFFWGLCLDIYGASLFGTQALLLAAAGYITGKLSRHLDANKLVAQEILVLTGTIIFFIGLYQIELIFRWPQKPHYPGFTKIILEIILNAIAAPVLFWGLSLWKGLWPGRIRY